MLTSVNIFSALTYVAELLKIWVPENEPEWYRNGGAWVKIFLEPIAPGKFKQHDYIYNVPGENEFPKERWSPAACRDGFHITRRKDVRWYLTLHDYKSAYIAEVVSMGEEFYDNPDQHKRKVRVVAFGPAVPLTEVLGKHPDDFESGYMLRWSAANNHLELVKLAISKNPDSYPYNWVFGLALKNGNEQIADFLFEKCENERESQSMLWYVICYGHVDLVKRMMENTHVDVYFFKAACEYGHFEIFRLLCANYGEPKCSDIILTTLHGGNVNILNYLKSRGVDMTDFGMFVYACTNRAYNLETVKYLVSGGADVKHPLIAYITKRHAHKKVREYLLTQIDDKSEVYWCADLDDEIVQISNTFFKRINAGEFDGK
jgi:hypothetical protein